MSRDLLMRGITYKLQERRLGGLSPAIIRKLERLKADNGLDERRSVPPISLKAGARLVREWRGVTHSVLVHDDGFEWRSDVFSAQYQQAPAPPGGAMIKRAWVRRYTELPVNKEDSAGGPELGHRDEGRSGQRLVRLHDVAANYGLPVVSGGRMAPAR